ncbi:putative phospholipid-binding lipoprotein MlaA [Candidatus Kinetoplastibacterium sorsogonicusi]|uniref:Putative phospholipid-binding lipoprotein MlaA n=1 Tax=Candidatus Kinetoplastidibacterium kentomonadis TaxID=1576550 RepID=A0A3Q8ETX6_9PROT|nr:VacJ family lipoprotein [Candidatus Kinetoplastibacterium sorsogonicusi]AWD32176.1 putative phospholipid-binding lipoprotein MlaA [Candidatus Kinetoplastibacterium sorsogonicusi]
MNIKKYRTKILKFLLISCYLIISGCSINQDNIDPFEKYNRVIDKFNEKLDKNLVCPITNNYTYFMPKLARQGINNFFSNIDDLWSAFNFILQGHGLEGSNSLGRFMLNTTMGLGGVFDIASSNGSFKYHNDFGITLAVWGIKQGPYLVLPILGPCSVRDGLGLMGSLFISTFGENYICYYNNHCNMNYIKTLYFLNEREKINNKTKLINLIALDKYSLIRDSYFQYRDSFILDKFKNNSVEYTD